MRGLILLLVFLSCPVRAFAQAAPLPTPPRQLAAVFTESLSTEEDIEFQRWADALARTERVAADFRALFPALEKAVATSEPTTVREQLGRLHSELVRQAPAGSYRAYFQLRQTFLALLKRFDYPFPPILLVIHHDLGSALQAATNNNREEVEHELHELELNYRQAMPELTERGITPQQVVAVMARIPRAQDALREDAPPEELRIVLQELEALLQQQHRQLAGDR